MQLRQVLAGALFTSALLVGPSLARADLIPSVPPECVGKPEGTPCTLGNGSAGQCAVRKDPRRPTVSYTVCDRDEHECDRLGIGAVCHGYLGKPAHCREFKNAEKTWRTCQLDEHQAAADAAGKAPAAAPEQAAPAATPAPAPAATPATTPPAAPAAAPETRGRFGCSTLPGAATGPTGALALARFIDAL